MSQFPHSGVDGFVEFTGFRFPSAFLANSSANDLYILILGSEATITVSWDFKAVYVGSRFERSRITCIPYCVRRSPKQSQRAQSTFHGPYGTLYIYLLVKDTLREIATTIALALGAAVCSNHGHGILSVPKHTMHAFNKTHTPL